MVQILIFWRRKNDWWKAQLAKIKNSNNLPLKFIEVVNYICFINNYCFFQLSDFKKSIDFLRASSLLIPEFIFS